MRTNEPRGNRERLDGFSEPTGIVEPDGIAESLGGSDPFGIAGPHREQPAR
jgi:hypothetical protein